MSVGFHTLLKWICTPEVIWEDWDFFKDRECLERPDRIKDKKPEKETNHNTGRKSYKP